MVFLHKNTTHNNIKVNKCIKLKCYFKETFAKENIVFKKSSKKFHLIKGGAWFDYGCTENPKKSNFTKNSTSVSRKKCWHTSFLALCTCQVSDLLDPLQILSTNRSTLVWTKLRYLLCENWLLVQIWHWNHIKPELPLLQILSKKRCQKVSQKYTNLKTHFK